MALANRTIREGRESLQRRGSLVVVINPQQHALAAHLGVVPVAVELANVKPPFSLIADE